MDRDRLKSAQERLEKLKALGPRPFEPGLRYPLKDEPAPRYEGLSTAEIACFEGAVEILMNRLWVGVPSAFEHHLAYRGWIETDRADLMDAIHSTRTGYRAATNRGLCANEAVGVGSEAEMKRYQLVKDRYGPVISDLAFGQNRYTTRLYTHPDCDQPVIQTTIGSTGATAVLAVAMFFGNRLASAAKGALQNRFVRMFFTEPTPDYDRSYASERGGSRIAAFTKRNGRDASDHRLDAYINPGYPYAFTEMTPQLLPSFAETALLYRSI